MNRGMLVLLFNNYFLFPTCLGIAQIPFFVANIPLSKFFGMCKTFVLADPEHIKQGFISDGLVASSISASS